MKSDITEMVTIMFNGRAVIMMPVHMPQYLIPFTRADMKQGSTDPATMLSQVREVSGQDMLALAWVRNEVLAEIDRVAALVKAEHDMKLNSIHGVRLEHLLTLRVMVEGQARRCIMALAVSYSEAGWRGSVKTLTDRLYAIWATFE